MSELKPCPFCASTAPPLPGMICAMGNPEPTIHVVMCQGCGAKSEPKMNRDSAIAVWNRRTPDYDALKAKVADLEKAAARYKFVRALNPVQFTSLYKKNLTTGIFFDRLVDEGVAFRQSAADRGCS